MWVMWIFLKNYLIKFIVGLVARPKVDDIIKGSIR